MRILVLGATGNVGRSIVEAALAGGHRVRAVSRGAKGLPEGADVYVGDLNDASTLAQAVDGAEAVFTLAGYDGLAETLANAARGGAERLSSR